MSSTTALINLEEIPAGPVTNTKLTNINLVSMEHKQAKLILTSLDPGHYALTMLYDAPGPTCWRTWCGPTQKYAGWVRHAQAGLKELYMRAY